jgi:hypothetical protein
MVPAMNFRSRPLFAFGLVAVAACRSGSKVASVGVEGTVDAGVEDVARVQKPIAVLDAGPRRAIILVDAGQEPRRNLEYAFVLGRPQRALLVMRMTMTLEAGSMGMPPTQLPAFSLGMTVTPEGREPNGDVSLLVEYDPAVVEPNEAKSLDPAAAKNLEEQLAILKTVRGHLTLSARGEVVRVRFDVPPGVTTKTEGLLSSIERQVTMLTPALPSEPLGKGATWEARADVENPSSVVGVSIHQTTTYRLVELRAGMITLDVGVKQHGDPQDLLVPSLPDGARVGLVAMDTVAQGRTVVDLTSPVPTSEADVATTVIMNVSDGKGRDERVKTTLGVRVRIDRGSADGGLPSRETAIGKLANPPKVRRDPPPSR